MNCLHTCIMLLYELILFELGYKTTGSVNIARTKERMIELRRLEAEARYQIMQNVLFNNLVLLSLF